MNKFRLLSLFTLLVLLLTACPGGGGGVGKVTGLTTTPQAGSIKVAWSYPTANNADIKGFQIWRNPDKDGNAKFGLIKTVSDVTKRSETDDTANDTTKKYYYGVAVIAKDGALGDRVDQPTTGPGTKPNPVDENTPPVATDDTLTVAPGGTGNVNVLTNDTDDDGDTLSVTSVTDGSTSKGTYDLAANGALSYTANAGTTGSDTVIYTVNDGNGGSDTGTVTITISTEALDLSFESVTGLPIKAGGANTAAVDAHYASGLPAGSTVASPPAGLSAIGADGSFTYEGASTTFDYEFGGDTGTVTIVIQPTTFKAYSTAILGATENILYITGDIADCATNCIEMTDGQKILGEGVALTAEDLGITDTDITPELVAAGTSPSLTSTTEQVIDLTGGATIKGVTLKPGTAGFAAGIAGIDDIVGDVIVENVTIDGGNFGIHIREPSPNNAKGEKYTLTVDNVTITNPEGVGILAGDAKTVTITNTEITGVGAGGGSIGVAGAGVRIESEFTTTVTIDNVTVAAKAAGAKQGFNIFKNNAFAHANVDSTETMTVSINNSTADFPAALIPDAEGFKLTIVSDAFDDVLPATGDVGILNISGTGNATDAASKKPIENTTGTVNDTLVVDPL